MANRLRETVRGGLCGDGAHANLRRCPGRTSTLLPKHYNLHTARKWLEIGIWNIAVRSSFSLRLCCLTWTKYAPMPMLSCFSSPPLLWFAPSRQRALSMLDARTLQINTWAFPATRCSLCSRSLGPRNSQVGPLSADAELVLEGV